MTKILITGATGLVGSTLAAGFLQRGAEVVCLERPDSRRSDGALERAKEKIAAAAKGFGTPLTDAMREKIHPVPYDLDRLGSAEFADALRGVDLVWHCAAHMDFDVGQLEEAWSFNVLGTNAFYRLVQRACPKKPRFIFASTCYVAGLGEGPHPEAFHLAPRLHNPYVVSKWGCEAMLREMSREAGALPITLFREPFVTGHSQTGWYGGKRMVLYAVLDACHMIRAMGQNEITVRLRADVMHSYIPIDDLVNNAVALSLDAKDEPLSIVHCLGTYLSSRRAGDAAEEVYGIKMGFGEPKTDADKAIDQFSAVYRHYHSPEAPARYTLDENRLPKLIGDKFQHHELDQKTLVRLMSWYANNRPPRGIPTLAEMNAASAQA